MKNIFAALLSIGFLTACASQIMQSYVGQPMQNVMLDYGPPVNAFDMPDGKRVFQWAKNVSYTTPAYVTSWTNSNAIITGGQTISDTCIYSLFADWDKTQKTWIITGFKKPDFSCE